MSDSVLSAAQELDTDHVVELWELDTTPLTNIFGVAGTGTIYRWTPNVLDYRVSGILLENSTTTLVILETQPPLPNYAVPYTMQVGRPSAEGLFSDPIPVTTFSTTTGISGDTVTVVHLASPLPEIPTAGQAWLLESNGSVYFGGIEYKPVPIEVTEMEWSGQGKLPRPRLRVSNIGGLAAGLVIQFGDIVGAQVTRRQTFKSFLDGEATPDSSATFEPDIFTVDRKSAHNKNFIEWELAAQLDQMGIRLPRRLVTRDHCNHTYRQFSLTSGVFIQGTCPYTDPRYFKIDGAGASTPQDDVCGKHLSDCLLRFTNNARLPFRGFPGVAETVG